MAGERPDRDEMWKARATFLAQINPAKTVTGRKAAGGKKGGERSGTSRRGEAGPVSGPPSRRPSDEPPARAQQDGVRRKENAEPGVWEYVELEGAYAAEAKERQRAAGPASAAKRGDTVGSNPPPTVRQPGRALEQAAHAVGAGTKATATLKSVRRDAPAVFVNRFATRRTVPTTRRAASAG